MDIRQAPLNTTLVGALRGVADYYDLGLSNATLFGGTGHAFVMNVHDELCPSGPYCWNAGRLLTANLGIETTDLGFFHSQSAPEQRRDVETALRRALDSGIPCSLLNMEHQLITGYDETGFDTAGPWPENEFPPRRMTFETWSELGTEIHLNFYTHRRVDAAAQIDMVRQSLVFAVDLARNPKQYTDAPYGIGPDAYDNWLAAIDASGTSHGNWWNATVWGECREYASMFFAEIAQWYPSVETQAGALADAYAQIARGFSRAADKEMASEAKKDIVRELKEQERRAVDGVEHLLGEMNGVSEDAAA